MLALYCIIQRCSRRQRRVASASASSIALAAKILSRGKLLAVAQRQRRSGAAIFKPQLKVVTTTTTTTTKTTATTTATATITATTTTITTATTTTTLSVFRALAAS